MYYKGVLTYAQIISDDNLGMVVAAKPNSPNTLHRLQVAILALLPVIPLPVDIDINWLGETRQVIYSYLLIVTAN